MATMIPGDIEEFGTEEENAFYPGSRALRPLPAGLHKFLEGVAKPNAHYLCWYTPDINGRIC